MAIFRRRTTDSSAHPITAFWSWRAGTGSAIDAHAESEVTDELTHRIAAIHPGLSWHFGPGDTSRHSLTVSAGGVAEVRPAAERWLRAAPAASQTWEFRSSQRADATALGNVLQLAGHSVDLSRTEFRIEPVEEEYRVHVGVYHPDFADLPQQARTQVCFLVLDWVVGEDDVERWLGHIEPLTVRPATVGTAGDLQSTLALFATIRDPSAWTLARWVDAEGLPGLAMFRRGLRWIDTPTFDRHQIVSAHYQAHPNGLPVDLDGLREIQSELESRLDTRGVLVGHETHTGVRTFHAYTDGEDQNVDADLQRWATTRRLTWKSRLDPSWREVRRFTG